MSLQRREALITAARSVDLSTSVDAELREIRAKLESIPEPVPVRTEARRRVAETASKLDAKRERVATLRGRLQEREDDALEGEYRAAIGALAKAETEHTAAAETLSTAREQARTARDSREQQLRLQDRAGNLHRTARRELLQAMKPKADAAVSDVPGGSGKRFATVDPLSAALVVTRLGRVERPIVLACDRFSDRMAAEQWLETPVYRPSPELASGLSTNG